MRKSLAAVCALLMAVLFGGVAWAADEMVPTQLGRASLMGSAIKQTGGEELYESVCQGCHMANGVGATAAGTYPPLAKNRHLAAKSFPLVRVLNGSKGMPAFSTTMSDEQIAAVVSYVRTHFGNAYKDKVTVADVKALRK
jgi:mono/diheme cytochrome c family protein